LNERSSSVNIGYQFIKGLEMEVIAYYRVSTKRQGDSGLGLEAQREYVHTAAKQNGWTITAEYTENAISGTVHPLERPEASKAFSHALPVVVAKLDRLSRDVEHIAGLMKRVVFRVATMPNADTLQLHLYAMLAQQERDFISQRTRAALEALKQRSDSGSASAMQKVANRTKALNKGRTKANQKKGGLSTANKAMSFALTVKDPLELCLLKGTKSYLGLADCLNDRGIKTARGNLWSAMQVKRVMDKLEMKLN